MPISSFSKHKNSFLSTSHFNFSYQMAGKTASAGGRGKAAGGKKAVSRSAKAGLQFPVGRAT
jgi:hypothetical protein